MITLLIPSDLLARLTSELQRAGSREIGGVLVGEHIGPETFKVVDLSVQRSGGTLSRFVRWPERHRAFLDDFFARTGGEYERFNYLGEWHSHPEFAPHPSSVDRAQMQGIVEEDLAPLFAVLLVTRLGASGDLEINAQAFRPYLPPTPVTIAVTTRATGNAVPAPKAWWRRLFGRRRPPNIDHFD